MARNKLTQRHVNRLLLRPDPEQMLGLPHHLVIDLDVRTHAPHHTHLNVYEFGEDEAWLELDSPDLSPVDPELAEARSLRLEADRRAPMSERLARVHALCKQMSAVKGAAKAR